MSSSPQMRICSHCAKLKPTSAKSCFYLDRWMCSRECMHAEGDRSACWQGCGCTGYAKKRRLLREHRRNMRVMDELIEDHGLEEELQERLEDETGNTNFWLGMHESMDEGSDEEDPEAALRKEVADKSAFLAGARCIVEARETATKLERARMRLEDLSGLR